MSIRILLVDDTTMFREGLRLVIGVEDDMQVVAAAADGEEGVRLALAHKPDVVLMDIRMPLMNGVEATRRLTAELPGTHVIVLTTYSDDDLVLDALKAGAVGYLLKDMDVADLIQTIRTVSRGGALIPPAIAAKLLSDYTRLANSGPPLAPALSGALPPPARPPGPPLAGLDLTARETEILRLVARGCSNREIADRLYLSEGTVRNYVSSIFSKLHARDRAQAVSFAHRLGLVD